MENIVRLRPNESSDTTALADRTACCVDLPQREMDGEARRAFRDRLTGRTPRSERGDRGSTPCPGSEHGRVAQQGERLSYKEEAAGSSPASRTRRRIAQVAERLSDEEEAAGSTPAPPTLRDRSSVR
jgi:hypothetical protein